MLRVTPQASSALPATDKPARIFMTHRAFAPAASLPVTAA
jgi:hypothetical protein